MSEDVGLQIENFFGQYRLRNYTKGQILILSGDQTEFIYYLVEGRVKEYDVTYRGDEIILNVFKPPAYFPMSLAVNNAPNPYIYEAETDIVIRQAPADEVLKFVKSNPEVMFNLLSRVYRGVDGLFERMAYLMAGSSAKNRLIHELLVEAKRFGVQQSTGGYLLVISEKDLGARAGLSRETISREMHKLKLENMIEVRSKEILIKDILALKQQISHEF